MNQPILSHADAGLGHVRAFHIKFGVPMSPVPAFLDKDAHEFRCKFMQEELDEFKDAVAEGNIDKALDALLDLVYVAKGTALKMGLPWDTAWPRVQYANMQKELAKPDGSNSKRGSPMDVIKPEGWVAPTHWDLLGLREGDPVPVFNATNAVLTWGAQRKAGEPLTPANEFVEYRNLSAKSEE
jgi:predicted HAD superfamily Cof-like phosphohydrolase